MTKDQPEPSATFPSPADALSRRGFMLASAAGLAGPGLGNSAMGCASSHSVSDSAPSPHFSLKTMTSNMLSFSDLPNFCSHEHWGSITPMGMEPEGYRPDVFAGALPQRRVTLIDLIADAYLNGFIHASGVNPNAMVKEAGLGDDLFKAGLDAPTETLRAIRPALRNNQFIGAYQCTRRGILHHYGFDINSDDPVEIAAVGKAVAGNYGSIFSWYSKAMDKAGFTVLIRPVHPVFYVREDTPESAAEERGVTHTIMRIDPFLEMWKTENPHREPLAEMAGVDPRDAATWRQFLDRIFEIAAEKSTTGIKQLQAYTRSLRFDFREDSEVKFAGDLTPEEGMVQQDWVMHECCKRAHERGWPHQVHVGTANLPDSNPLPLRALAHRYPSQKIVMLHCWPFFDESGFLAKSIPNMFIDTCWQPVLSPDFLRLSMELWLRYVPTSKIMLSHDSTTVEMATGSSLFTREILAESLGGIGESAGVGEEDLREAATAMLHSNAVGVYRVGEVQ